MDLACNIDRRGRMVRGLIGIAGLLLALILVFTVPPSGWRRGLVTLLAIAGSFCLFEGLRGWCVLRALGIRTRL